MSSFVYDANGQLTKESLPDGTINTYAYDKVGNRTASDINGETAAFTYNEANQIATKYVYWGPKVKVTYIDFGRRN